MMLLDSLDDSERQYCMSIVIHTVLYRLMYFNWCFAIENQAHCVLAASKRAIKMPKFELMASPGIHKYVP